MTNQRLKTRLSSIKREAEDILSFDFASLDGRALPPFTAGDHIDVLIPGGFIRQYSLCNGPSDAMYYRIAVKREAASRGGSRAMHERMRIGDTVTVGLPRNNFRPDSTAAHHFLVGGGIGITPLFSMAQHLSASNASFELHYFARSAMHAAFREPMAQLFGARVHFHYGLDAEGLRPHFRQIFDRQPAGTHLYVCGPNPFMEALVDIAAQHWDRSRIHLEHFAAPAGHADSEGPAFEVRLADTRQRFTIPPNRTIAQVLAEHGVDIETSCEMGVCGTCVVRVLEGTPDHRDVYLTDEEKTAGKKIATCISRAKSPSLVLDV